ncbi:MAG: hypothetical protein NC236_01550 [Mycoplasma sp.]|nr:hypothetical protein [Mycoplasma sp.]
MFKEIEKLKLAKSIIDKAIVSVEPQPHEYLVNQPLESKIVWITRHAQARFTERLGKEFDKVVLSKYIREKIENAENYYKNTKKKNVDVFSLKIIFGEIPTVVIIGNNEERNSYSLITVRYDFTNQNFIEEIKNSHIDEVNKNDFLKNLEVKMFNGKTEEQFFEDLKIEKPIELEDDNDNEIIFENNDEEFDSILQNSEEFLI